MLVSILTIFVLAPAPLLATEKLPRAGRTPDAPTPAQSSVIQEGMALHDAGNFAGAISKYEQVLKESPHVVAALYELAASYAGKRDCLNAMVVARRGAEYKSELLPQFHMLFGDCLDSLGKRLEAIDIYKAAIQTTPDFALLHYNLALTYVRLARFEDAKKAAQQSLFLNPAHASSHYLLGIVYQQLGYRVPAILGLSSFLLMEPSSSRSGEALVRLNGLLGEGLSRSETSDEISVLVQAKSKKDEGDFDAVMVAMTLALAAHMSPEKKPTTPFELITTSYSVMSGVLAKPEGKGFALRYYAPFFANLDTKDFVEAFVYHALASARLQGATEWARDNPAKISGFQQWLASYRWPSK